MSEKEISHVIYGDEKVTITSAPAKGDSISVFARPGDKISFNFDVSKAQFKMVGGDIVVRIPGEGEIVFVSMAALAFEENPLLLSFPLVKCWSLLVF